MFKINNKNTRTMSVTSFWVFIVNVEQISRIFFLVFIGDFEQVNVGWIFPLDAGESDNAFFV